LNLTGLKTLSDIPWRKLINQLDETELIGKMFLEN
jgi:hypothetical protein